MSTISKHEKTLRTFPKHHVTHVLPISSGARQHFVDAVDVEGVGTDTNMERILAAVLHQILKHEETQSQRVT